MSFSIAIDGEYGDEDTQISLLDGDAELVAWTSDEWKEDPSLVVVIANAIRIGYTEGAAAVRNRLEREPSPHDPRPDPRTHPEFWTE